MADIAGVDAQIDALFADNTNEDVTPEDVRTGLKLITSSFANLEDTASITGAHTYAVVVSGVTPTADAHLATKKYVDDNVSAGAGDVVGPSSAADNEIVTFNTTTGKLVQGNSGVTISDVGDFAGVGNIAFGTATDTIAGIQNNNLVDKTSNETIASGAVWTFTDSPIVPAPTTDLQAATKKYVDDNSGSGDVTKVGTPVNNELGVWTGDGTLEGDSNLTWNAATLAVGGAVTATTFNGVALSTAGSSANVLAEDGTYVALAGGGDVTKVSTPVNNEIGVWTGDGTLEGDTNFTWDGSTHAITGAQTISSTLTVSGATALAATTIEVDDATTNSSVTVLEVTRTTSGTPANGIGADIEFHVETSASNTEKLGIIEINATDVTAANEDGKMSFLIMQAGTAATEKMAIAADGDVTATSFNGVALTDGGSSANYLREDGTYGSIGALGGGDVNKVGTPSNNQIAVWTGDGTVDGDANFTWSGSTFQVVGSQTVSVDLTVSNDFEVSGDTLLSTDLTVDGVTQLNKSMTMTKATGLDAANPCEITLTSSNDGTWVSGAEYGQLNFSTSDSDGTGSGSIRAAIRAYHAGVQGLHGLKFYTNDGSALTNALTIKSNFETQVHGVLTADDVISCDDTTDSTSTVSGSIHTDGGLGVVKKSFFGDKATFEADIQVYGFLNLGTPTELTISSGVITATRSIHIVDTENDNSTDDLDTINGGTAGDILILYSANNSRDVTVKDAADNIFLASSDFTLSHKTDTLTLFYSGSSWRELSRSNNS